MKKDFNADVEQLIKLVTHSIYSNKEIFLRELISNANDAIQKAKLKSANDTNYLWDDVNFEIKIDIDLDKKTLTIIDNWIGMTKEELESNIWTIASSWTKKFIDSLKNKKDSDTKWNDFIWQFWVGFYSTFMVADKVEILTKSNEDKNWYKWISEWKSSYEVEVYNKKNRWTEIILYLNKDNEEYLDKNKIKEIIKKHSNYVPVSILMKNDDKKYEQINDMKSIWTKNKNEVKKEEYIEFYKDLTFDMSDPLDYIHTDIEWSVTYKSLLFIPQKKNPFSTLNTEDKERWPSLYVQNVMIMNKTKELLPVWLRFVRWVVETNDLSLNVSREILQNSWVINKIQKTLVKEVLKSLSWKMKNNLVEYKDFFNNFWQILKEGIHFDFDNKEKIAEISLFYSMEKNDYITFDDYIKWKEEKIIYYLTWLSIDDLKNSPYLFQFKEKNVDVLLMKDPIDEYVINSLQEYKWYKFKLASSENVDLMHSWDKKTDKDEGINDDKKSEFSDFKKLIIEKIWKEKVSDVKIVDNLWDILSITKVKEWDITPQMKKIMKAMWQDVPDSPKLLNINKKHPIFKKIIALYNKDKKSKNIDKYIDFIYEQAVWLWTWEIENINSFMKIVNDLLS